MQNLSIIHKISVLTTSEQLLLCKCVNVAKSYLNFTCTVQIDNRTRTKTKHIDVWKSLQSQYHLFGLSDGLLM